MKLSDDIITLKGIGEKTKESFYHAGIFNVNDLLHYFPRNYLKIPSIIPIAQCKDKERCIVRARIVREAQLFAKGKLRLLNFQVADQTGLARVAVFGMPYLKKTLIAGREIILFGVCKRTANSITIEQPKFLQEDEYQKIRNSLQPIYSLSEGLTNAKLGKMVEECIGCMKELTDYLPAPIREEKNLLPIEAAVKMMHFPTSIEDVYEARRRLAFDEFFLFIVKMYFLKADTEKNMVKQAYVETAEVKRLIEQLPYPLTNAQGRAIHEIAEDLCSGYQMNRLLQGDVGCGKTIIAFCAALLAVTNGYQAAIMVPTEVLAAQHFRDITGMIKKYHLPFEPVLLCGSLKAKEKRIVQEDIAKGKYNLIIGTHALIQDKVEYRNLGLVVTDEQHRFGVRQRMQLMEKGQDVHVLVMSATPIPRTLALILYGDLDVTVINELPAKRLPIKNTVVDESYRPKLYQFIMKRISEGRQVYIICPMVEEGDMDHVVNVSDYTQELKATMPPNIRIAMLHGKMKPAIKDEIMQEFKDGNIDILVSTTVVEVGVNVPNATVIMVENAERFGLSQLHQLRGRVGRGEEQSYCIFVAGNNSEKTIKRLEILNKTNDGFEIAREDLKQRGPGDFFGLKQSGMPDFAIADIFTDSKELMDAKEVREILKRDYHEEMEQIQKALISKENFTYIDFHSICL